MHIAIDASRSIDAVQKTGVEVVSDALLKEFVSLFITNGQLSTINYQPTFYTPQLISWLPKDQQRIIPRKKFWTIIGLSLAMLRDKPDALFVPVHTLPFFCPKKTVRIVHDVSFLRKKDAYSLRERLYMRFDLWRAQRICSHIIVPTEAVKRDLVELLGFSTDKVLVTGWGAPSSYGAGSSYGRSVLHGGVKTLRPYVSHTALRPYDDAPFILFLGRIEEKKNVANIIRAFSLFRKEHPEWRMLLAGKPGYGFSHIEPLLKTEGVEYLGYISEEKKAELLATARMLVLVSYEEGFAFPMLEAFQANVPVLASSIPVLREIAQDAALFSDPDDCEALAQNMDLLSKDDELCQRIISAGKQRLAMYSWKQVAEKIMRCLV